MTTRHQLAARLLLPLLLTALTGCLQTSDHRVRVRREAALLDERQFSGDPEDYVAFLDEQERRRQESALPPELFRSIRLERARRKAIERALADRSDDPWRDYERDREAVLLRPWPDSPWREPPTPEPLEGEEPAAVGGASSAPDEVDEDEEEDEWNLDAEDAWGR